MTVPSDATSSAPIVAEAEQCYLMAPEFHAKVHTAVQVIDQDLHDRTGAHLDNDDRRLAVLAASVALIVARRMDTSAIARRWSP